MQRLTQRYVLRSLRCALAACLIWGISASVALAQWPKLPKVPKLPG